MAKAKKTGVVYTFSGEYYYKQDKGLGTKSYELSVTFPNLLQAPLAVFKGGVSKGGHPVRNLMLKKYPDFVSVRTFSVLSVANYNTATSVKTNDINVMNIDQLKSYIEDKSLGIDTEVYKNDVNKVRAAITLAESNPEDFAETYKKVVEEYEYEKQIEALNSDNNGTENTENAESAESTENTGAEDVNDLLKDLDEGANV